MQESPLLLVDFSIFPLFKEDLLHHIKTQGYKTLKKNSFLKAGEI